MVSPARHHRFSYAEYLEREQATGLKHEWLDGQIFAMAGGSPEHARLIGEVVFALRSLTGTGPCRVFSSELKLRVRATGLATYPDVAVVCGPLELDAEDRHAVTNPTLIVEVLSPSTEAYDRGEKWSHYRRMPSLQAYILVDQIKPRLEMYERTPDGFLNHIADAGQELVLRALGGSIRVDGIYASSLALLG
jgi:Uma2 family endonuclease